MTTVFNLDAGEEHNTYSCSPREAVLAAFGQSTGNQNSWEYETKYGHLVRKTASGWTCGKFWVQDTFGEINITPA